MIFIQLANHYGETDARVSWVLRSFCRFISRFSHTQITREHEINQTDRPYQSKPSDLCIYAGTATGVVAAVAQDTV